MGFRIRSRMLFVVAVALVAVLGLSAGQASANHVHCGDTLTQNTTLDSFVGCPETGVSKVGLSIGADNITLNLNNYGVRGNCNDFDTAIVNPGHSGITIENGSVVGGLDGLVLQDATRNQVRNIRAGSCLEYVAIRLDRSNDNLLEGCIAGTYRGRGISLADSANNTITNCDSSGNGLGLDLQDSSGNRIDDSTFRGNNLGIALHDSADNRIERSVVFYGGGYPEPSSPGILVQRSDGTRIKRNTVFSNLLDGIRVVDSSRTRLVNNVLRSNGYGYYEYSPNAPRDGLFVDETSNETFLLGNVASDNGDDGIDTESPSTTLIANTANGNADSGIEAVQGVIDGGGNRAFGNGNPLQCLNVVCK